MRAALNPNLTQLRKSPYLNAASGDFTLYISTPQDTYNTASGNNSLYDNTTGS